MLEQTFLQIEKSFNSLKFRDDLNKVLQIRTVTGKLKSVKNTENK